MNDPAKSTFHAGEIAIQTRTGVAERVARFGQKMIRTELPDQHREFYRGLPFIFLGMLDRQGNPWATPVFGEPGFIQSPIPSKLVVNGLPLFAGQLDLSMAPGSKVGVLGIELQTRRRNRMNGIFTDGESHSLAIQVEQSFGNCPQYIQTRRLRWRENSKQDSLGTEIETSSAITRRERNLIQQADTFFIASRTRQIEQDNRYGVDVSHRGGKPGFVKVNESGDLVFPDFQGNNFFNTLGNIQTDPRVGLFFTDFEKGNVVFINGTAKIIWKGKQLEAFEGAQRLVKVAPKSVIYSKQVLAMEGTLIELSPAAEKTGSW